MKRKIFFLLGTMLLLFNLVVAQSPRPFQSIQSPNASSFKAGIESPVTLDVGKIGVNIPLYTVQDKDLSIPLNMKYNSSGVKPDVHPGWVGQNWNLSAGMITRNIRGIPDEMYWRNDYNFTISSPPASDVLFVGYAFNYPNNQGANWNTTARITDLAKAGSTSGTYWTESEPDEFFFSCGSYSGSFFITQEGLIAVQGEPGIKVEGEIIYNVPFGFDPGVALNVNNPYSYSSVTNYGSFYSFNRCYVARIKGFKITTPDGVQYEFGMYGQIFDPFGTYDDVEFTADIFEQFYFSEIFTTWCLKKVTSPSTGAVINFTYERGYPVIQVGRSFSFYKAGGTAPAKGFLGWLFGGVSSYTQQAREERNGRFIRPTYLKSIETSDTRIDFTTSPTTELKYDYSPIVVDIALRSEYYSEYYEAPSLFSRLPIGECYYLPYPYHPGYTAIVQLNAEAYRIFRGDGLTEDLDFSLLKWEKLDFMGIKAKGASTYTKTYNFNYTSSSTQRLQLLSITDSDMPNPYIFTYNSSYTLPGYNSMKIDHWGYFNNYFAQVNINDVNTLIGYKALREPVDTYLYPEILTKVTYPTKGYKEFTYEPNKYKAIVTRNTTDGSFPSPTILSTEKSGGGLRISQVREVSGNGQPDMVTSYEYGEGLLNGDIQYYWPGYEGRLLNGNVYTSDRFVTESLIPSIENTAGGIVSYSKVTEKMPGLGRTEYDFKTFYSNPDEHGNSIDPHKSPYSPFSSKSFERGLVLEKRTYDNTTVLPLIREVFNYQPNPGLATQEARAVQSKGLILFDGGGSINAIEGTSYTNYLYPYQKISKLHRILDKTTSTYASTFEEYTYDNDATFNDNQLKRLKVTNSDGSVLVKNTKHTWDYTTGSLGNSYPEAEGLSLMYNQHIIDKPILVEQRITKAGLWTDSITSVNFSTFRKSAGVLGDIAVLHKVYSLEAPAPIPSYSLAINTTSLQLDGKLKLQTHFSDYGNYGNLREAQYRTVKDVCLWEHKGRFAVAIARNASLKDIAFTSFEGSSTDQPSLSYSSNVVTDATAPTGKYVYNLSNGAISKSQMDPAKKYIVTYWVKGTTLATINNATIISGESGIVRNHNGWTQYRCALNSTTGFSLSGSGLFIDDVRVHPSESAMTTYTYDPQIGLTSMTDEKGVITYYDYDSANRLKSIRDLNGNITKSYDYHYKP